MQYMVTFLKYLALFVCMTIFANYGFFFLRTADTVLNIVGACMIAVVGFVGMTMLRAALEAQK